jgi:hypothetical protein
MIDYIIPDAKIKGNIIKLEILTDVSKRPFSFFVAPEVTSGAPRVSEVTSDTTGGMTSPTGYVRNIKY